MPLIVLEGPRRAGKFTLAMELIKAAVDTPVVYKHNAFSTPAQMAADIEFASDNMSLLHIWDRSYLSEYVYWQDRPGSRRVNTMLMPHSAAEKLYGPILDAVGVRYVLMAPADTLRMRNPSSSVIDIDTELSRYATLAADTGWRRLDISTQTPEILKITARDILAGIYEKAAKQIPTIMLMGQAFTSEDEEEESEE